jgi:hypothetical protein
MTLILHEGGPQDGGVEEVPPAMTASGELQYARSGDAVNDVYRRSEPVELVDTAKGAAEVWVHVTTSTPVQDGEPFPDPYPTSTAFGPLDSDNAKEWRKDKRKWEEEHGPPPT